MNNEKMEKNVEKIVRALLPLLAVMLPGCSGESSSGSNGANGMTSLISVVSESPGANCANGGSLVNAGLDVNGNGMLDASEITTSSYICNGPGNRAPISNAGSDQKVTGGAVVTLDGTASSDPDGNPIHYVWAISSRPSGSTATLSNTSVSKPTFTADRIGRYEISLVASDGWFDGEPDTVIVWAGTRLPDTGQTTKYSTAFGDDSDYAINPMSFIDNSDGTITDNVTELAWQKCPLGQGGNDCASGAATMYGWADAAGACASLDPAAGWRLPTDLELMTIVDYGSHAPALSATYFPNTDQAFWSSATYADDATQAWAVWFYDGSLVSANKSDGLAVRCVRNQ